MRGGGGKCLTPLAVYTLRKYQAGTHFLRFAKIEYEKRIRSVLTQSRLHNYDEDQPVVIITLFLASYLLYGYFPEQHVTED